MIKLTKNWSIKAQDDTKPISNKNGQFWHTKCDKPGRWTMIDFKHLVRCSHCKAPLSFRQIEKTAFLFNYDINRSIYYRSK